MRATSATRAGRRRRARRYPRLGCLLLALAAAGCETAGAPSMAMEDASGEFAIANRQVPLPPGNWHVALRRAYASRLGVPLIDAVLIRAREKRVDGLVWITANRRPAGANGWRHARFCDDAASDGRKIHSNGSGGDQDCWTVRFGPTALRDATDPSLAKLADYAAHDGLALFDTGATVRYRLASARDLMEVSYMFDAAADAPMMKRWAETWHVKMRLGFHGILRQRRPPAPRPTADAEEEIRPPAITIGMALPSPGRPLGSIPGIIGDVPADDAVSAELIHRNFERVVFQTEYGGPIGWLRKWNRHPVIRYRGPLDGATLAALRQATDTLSTVTGLRLKLQPVASGNFDRRGDPFVRDNITLLRPERKNGDDVCYGRVKFAANGTISMAAIYISREFDYVPIRECLMEEIAQVLGPMNDTALIRQSMFNDQTNGIVSWLTWHDAILLRALYDQRLKPGMPKAEALPIARRVIGELLRDLNRAPPVHMVFGAAPAAP